MWEAYITPATLEGALKQLSEHTAESRIVAGATDLMLELERGVRKGITRLIDITRIPGLDQISEDDGWIRMGPLVSHNQCAGSPLIREHAGALAQACWEVGAPQIRNRGTIAGNLITASPANDSIPPLLVLEAQLTLRSIRGERSLPLADFYTGVRKTAMAADEILTEIRFKKSMGSRRSAFFKLGLRRAQAISVVNAAVVLDFDGETILDAHIALGSVAPVVIQAPEAEAYLTGKTLDKAIIERAGELAMQAAQPIDDIRGSAGYRRHMVQVCVRRALSDLLHSGGKTRVPEHPVMLWGERGGFAPAGKGTDLEHLSGTPIETLINNQEYTFHTGQNKSLLRLLREEAGLTGTKEGCAEGECGACTVFLDGVAVMACLVPAPRAHGADVITVEGLASDHGLHPVQQAFLDEGAVQCGYCTPGFLMSGAKLLEEREHPSRDEIAQALTGNLCRCTGYYKIISAIESAASVRER
jgi:xanthine dehydrogenase iron-sulfur cluster and FAD-binding subunit A